MLTKAELISVDALDESSPQSLRSARFAVELLMAHRAGKLPPRDAADWYDESLIAFICDNNDSMGEAFHLMPAARNAVRLEMRDSHLRKAWRILQRDCPLDKTCAEKLANEIKTFQSTVWARARDMEDPEPTWSMVRRYIWLARFLGPLPASERHILRICRGDDQ